VSSRQLSPSEALEFVRTLARALGVVAPRLPAAAPATHEGSGPRVGEGLLRQVTLSQTTTTHAVRAFNYERRMPLLSKQLMRERFEFARRFVNWNFAHTVVVAERWFPEENAGSHVIRAFGQVHAPLHSTTCL
jgi:hypothetical protein